MTLPAARQHPLPVTEIVGGKLHRMPPPPSRRHCHSWVIPIVVLEKPSSLLIEHDGFIHFDERPLDHRLRQSVPLQYPIIDPHQHFELCERCLPKVLVLPCPPPGGFGEILHRLLVDRTWLHLIPGGGHGRKKAPAFNGRGQVGRTARSRIGPFRSASSR